MTEIPKLGIDSLRPSNSSTPDEPRETMIIERDGRYYGVIQAPKGHPEEILRQVEGHKRLINNLADLEERCERLVKAYSSFIELHCVDCEEGSECVVDCFYVANAKQALKEKP